MDRIAPRPPGLNTLRLVPAVESYAREEGNRTVYVQVPFLDFVVDGQSVRESVAAVAHGRSFVTGLCRTWVSEAVQGVVDDLLGGARGRERTEVDLLVCSVCGDRGCGAIIVDVQVTAGTVMWNNWRYADAEAVESLPLLPAVTFDRDAYEALIASAAEAVARLPYDEQDGPRTFLWPWQWSWRLPRRR